jgi:hypothetical protein
MTPEMISRMKPIRMRVAGSLKNIIPMITVPIAPILV